MIDVVHGMGELGTTICNLMICKGISIVGNDIDKSRCIGVVNDAISVNHICFPYSDSFINDVLDVQNKYPAPVTIIHSTVKPGTTNAIQNRCGTRVVCSPTRGVHSRFMTDILRYTKFYSYYGNPSYSVRDAFGDRFNSFKFVSDPLTLETAKLLVDTTYYGLLISYRKIIDEISDKYKVDREDVWQFADEIQEFVGNRPKLYNDDNPIGGHCVIENLDLLPDFNSNLNKIKEIIKSYGHNL